MKRGLPFISVIIPVYGCTDCLMPLTQRIKKTLTRMKKSYEIIYVDDRGGDDAWSTILKLHTKNQYVKGIRLSRNFGQHHAITAGVEAANGQYIVVMDCDLQDQPEEIITLYEKIRSGYDIIFARRTGRQDTIFKSLISRLFHKTFMYLSGLPGDDTVGNFSIVNRSVISELKKLKEQNRSYLQSIKWLGFSQGYADVKHSVRFAGNTAYTIPKLLSYAIDSITAHSDKPLKLSIIMGLCVAVFSFIFGIIVILRYLFFGISITGWASMIVSLYFLSGLVFCFLGILGLYIGKIFDESKGRPIYVKTDSVGF